MPTEFENLNEESFKDEAGNLKSHEKQSAETESYLRDQERIQKRRDTVHKVFICSIWTIWWTAFFLLLVRVWHLVDGFGWYVWLGEDKLDDIDKILIALVSGGIVARYVQKHIT